MTQGTEMDDRLQYLLDVHEIREISVLYNRYADACDGASGLLLVARFLWIILGSFL